MRSRRIDMDYLLFAWQDDSPDNAYYLDLHSGCVELVQRGLLDLKELTERIELNRRRYLYVPKPDYGRAKKELIAFLDSITNPDIVRLLPVVLESPDPFGASKSVLGKHPDELKRWEEFRVQRVRNQVEEWLAANFIALSPDGTFQIEEEDAYDDEDDQMDFSPGDR